MKHAVFAIPGFCTHRDCSAAPQAGVGPSPMGQHLGKRSGLRLVAEYDVQQALAQQAQQRARAAAHHLKARQVQGHLLGTSTLESQKGPVIVACAV